MTKRKIAICDSDALYRERFAAYLLSHKSEEMDIHVFSTIDIFLENMQKEDYDLVLLEESMGKIAAEAGGLKMPVLILTSDVGEYVAEEVPQMAQTVQDSQEKKKIWEPSYTSKFQPMDAMLRKIYLMTDTKEHRKRGQYALSEMEVVGVCSPIHHEMQQLFSIVHAMQMSGQKRILYLNFLEYSGFLELFAQNCEYDMGDLIIRLRNGKLTSELFRQCVYEMRDISYIAPFQNPENIQEFCLQDYQLLLGYLAEYTDYEMVIVDLGGGMKSVLHLLAECSHIFCLMKDGFFYQCQLKEFLEYAQKMGEEALLQKMEIIEFPYSAKWIKGGTNLIEQLNWSEFGDFVRNYRLGGEL